MEEENILRKRAMDNNKSSETYSSKKYKESSNLSSKDENTLIYNTMIYSHFNHLLLHESSFTEDGFSPSSYQDSYLPLCRALVIGAGALGCEIIKNLVVMGFQHIDILDMDLIELSNLNRQFLFRKDHIGQSKAVIAAKSFESYPNLSITPHFCKLQDRDPSFYKQFHVVLCGLDSIEARRWINAMMASCIEVDNVTNEPNKATMIPIIDGGTEGFKGQTRVILLKETGCIECNLDLFPNATERQQYPLCTIAHTPRLPEHCIEWAYLNLIEGNSEAQNDDEDDLTHPDLIRSVFEKANQRANEFGIHGVTLSLVLGVVKSIIPAVASTNAIIGASCALEAFKLVTLMSPPLDDYCMVIGNSGWYGLNFKTERNEHCLICNNDSNSDSK